MQQFYQQMEEIINKINFLESRRIKFGKFVRKINDEFKIGSNEEIADVQIINKIPDQPLDKISLVGIDGGIVKKSYHGFDLLLMRAAGVNFIYEKNKLKEVNYYPSSNPLPEPKMFSESFSDNELNSCYNFERQIMEIEAAIEATKKMKPGIVFLDGSVIPHYVNKPDNGMLKDYYQKLIEKYKELFELGKEQKIILAGIIEDSRGAKFSDILNRRLMSKMGSELSSELQQILEKTKDTNLLFYTLKKGERTCTFNYSVNPDVHPILKEFECMKNELMSFYVKTADFDRPVRVDFVNNGNAIQTANQISSVLMKTSCHAGYGFPTVLIEADQRAKLSEKDIDMFYSDLVSKVGNASSLFKLRREMRPF